MQNIAGNFIFKFLSPLTIIMIVIGKYFPSELFGGWKLLIPSLVIYVLLITMCLYTKLLANKNPEKFEALYKNNFVFYLHSLLNIITNGIAELIVDLFYYIVICAGILLMSIFPVVISVLIWIKISNILIAVVPAMHLFANHFISLIVALTVWITIMSLAGKVYAIYEEVAERMEGLDAGELLKKRWEQNRYEIYRR